MRSVLAACALLLVACNSGPQALSPEEVSRVEVVTAATLKCQAEGRAAHSYEAYHCCMVRAGLHTGSCKADAGVTDAAVVD